MSNTAKKKGGRRGKYVDWITPEGLIKLQGWSRDGLSDEQLAEKMGIHVSTLYDWKNDHSEIAEALREGKEIPDRKVENALYQRCFDHTVKIAKTFKVKETGYDDNGKRWEREHLENGFDEVAIPADTKAQQFWLSNRKPDMWRDKKDVELSGNVDFSSVIAQARERAKNAEAADEQH